MGGNAIANQGFPVTRLNREDYNRLKDEVMNILSSYYHYIGVKQFFLPEIPKSYENKDTFGDIDILMDLDGLPDGIDNDSVIRGLMKHYDVCENPDINKKDTQSANGIPYSVVHRNGSVVSVGIPVIKGQPENGLFQVDLISSHTPYFKYNVNYFSWNDLGNLMGVIASKTNQLKHGHDGLHAMVRDGDHLLGTVELTTDFTKGLEFLGYDPKRYYEGFEDLEAIYTYASSPKWFDPEYFLDVNRSHTQRIRDRKRSTYSGFLKWCEVKKLEGYFNGKERVTDDLWKNRVNQFFPEFKEKEEALRVHFAKKKAVRQYFNGGLIIEQKVGIQGPELGKFMERLKTHFKDNDAFEDFILANKDNAVSLLLKMENDNPTNTESSANSLNQTKKKTGLKP